MELALITLLSYHVLSPTKVQYRSDWFGVTEKEVQSHAELFSY